MESLQADVLVIGAGGAGVTAAVEARKAGASVVLVSKEAVGYGDTRISLGAMSASPDTSSGDSEEAFIEDMIRGGDFLNDPDLVAALVRDALDAALTFESYGHLFFRDQAGALKRLEVPPGGHRASRTITSPSVGVSMGHVMRAAAARAGFTVLEETICSDLLLHEGRVVGTAALRLADGTPLAILARSTILAAGGAGALYYPHTDCMPSVVGDSFGLALQAGADLVDMEQVQFIPFGITHPPAMLGAPCGEPSMAGPFGRLLNCRDEVVLENIMTLTRAQVARVIIEEIRRGGATPYGGLKLDLRPNLDNPAGELFVTLLKQVGGPFLDVIRRAYGERALRLEEPWDVLPSAHYNMGGVKTDPHCRTRVPCLYACGQAQGGVMGGNRLGSTSLTEIFVFGKRAGKTAAREAEHCRTLPGPEVTRPAVERLGALAGRRGGARPIELKRRLQRLMWERVGPLRDEQGLEIALGEIGRLRRQARDLSINAVRQHNLEMADAIELGHMLAAAEAIALSARERRESRGAHVRADFPDRDDQKPVRNMVVQLVDGAYAVRSAERGR